MKRGANMAAKYTCPSCNTGDVKQIGDMVKQQAAAGVKSGLAEQYNPPKQPWAYVQGFLLAVPVNIGIMLSMASPETSGSSAAMADLLSTVGFLSVWFGYGVWKNKAYTKQLDEWKTTVGSKLHCLKCGHVFES
jgi:amino acid permease